MLAEIEAPQLPNRQGADPLTIQEVMAYYNVPGLSIAVIHDFTSHVRAKAGTSNTVDEIGDFNAWRRHIAPRAMVSSP